jgi:hypothetical protein
MLRKKQVSLSGKKNGYFIRTPMYICDNIVALTFSDNEECFRQVVEKMQTHVLYSVTFFCKIMPFVE